MTHEERILREINRPRKGRLMQRVSRWLSTLAGRMERSRMPQIKDAVHVL